VNYNQKELLYGTGLQTVTYMAADQHLTT